MAEQTITFNPSALAGAEVAQAVTITEADAIIVTNPGLLAKSQLTFYFNATMGTATSLHIRYYYADGSVDGSNNLIWFRQPIKGVVSGILVDCPTVIDSTSPSTSSGVYRVTEDVKMSACQAFKVSIQGVGGTTGLATVTTSVLVRDN